MNCLPPILLTSSVIAMDRSVYLKDEGLRIFHTLESIGKWFEICPDAKFVICDGSGFDFSEITKDQFPLANIECLFFNNEPNLIHLHGKGYGEGEIIRYAIRYSKTLKNSTWFAKCTAKLWVDNFLDCTQVWNGKFLCQPFFSNVFSFKEIQLQYVDTRFYLVDKNFYINNLSKAHIDIGGPKGISIEDKFLDVIHRENLEGVFFTTPPIVCGVGGGSGKYYKDSPVRRLKEILRSRLISLQPKYKKFFSKQSYC